jgi:hypothetical protein
MPITKHPRTGRYVAGADRLIRATMTDPVDECGPKKKKRMMDATVPKKATRGVRPRDINR